MPWSIDPNHEACNEGEVAVVNDESGNLVACHESRDDAQAQIAALNANVDEAISESSDAGLTESHIREDGTARVLLITPGMGSSGYYPQEVLERDGPEVFPANTSMFLDHPTDTETFERPERSVRDLAGVLTEDARFREDGPDGPGLYARARIFSPFRSQLAEQAPHIGLSIRGRGEAHEGELPDGTTGTIFDRLVSMESVDFVTRAGRGGRILALSESDRDHPLSEARNVGEWIESRLHLKLTTIADNLFGSGNLTRPERIALSNAVGEALDAFQQALSSDAPDLYQRDPEDMPNPDGQTATEEHNEETPVDIEEANARIDELEESVTDLRESVDTLEDERDDARRRAERAEEALLERDARDHARTVLAGRAEDADGNTVDVPALRESAHRRIVSQVLSADLPTDEDGELDTGSLTESVVDAAQEEAAYLAEAAGAGSVEGFGPSTAPDEDGPESADDFRKLGLPSDVAESLAVRN